MAPASALVSPSKLAHVVAVCARARARVCVAWRFVPLATSVEKSPNIPTLEYLQIKFTLKNRYRCRHRHRYRCRYPVPVCLSVWLTQALPAGHSRRGPTTRYYDAPEHPPLPRTNASIKQVDGERRHVLSKQSAYRAGTHGPDAVARRLADRSTTGTVMRVRGAWCVVRL